MNFGVVADWAEHYDLLVSSTFDCWSAVDGVNKVHGACTTFDSEFVWHTCPQQ